MIWTAVVAALDATERFRSRVTVYSHPLAGRPIVWHVVSALAEVSPPPSRILVLHHDAAPPAVTHDVPGVQYRTVRRGDEARALRAAVTSPGLTLLVDGACPLLSAATHSRLLRAADGGLAALAGAEDHSPIVAAAGEGPALASADDPRHPRGAARVAPPAAEELWRVVDRHSLALATAAMRDRVVLRHERAGATFLLPATCLVDVDVEIAADSVIYPGVVLEGATKIGAECVIGPYSRVVESSVGRGAELKGWNYVSRTSVRNHAVLEAYERRGID
jgi:bifunctional N-acetylglucosamine-1-phosphate-uridyltransferase/glucosamine-1-phosphate-acetyltransferase GlmU-like protein